jgi:hypothetical protein
MAVKRKRTGSDIKGKNRRGSRTAGSAAVDPAASLGPNGGVGSLGEWVRYLWPSALADDAIPVWPPDAFAVSAAFLRRTGAYVGLVNGLYSEGDSRVVVPEEAERIGEAWRMALNVALADGESAGRLRDACPQEIQRWWNELRRCAILSLFSAADDGLLVTAMCNMAITADTACGGIGVEISDDPFLAQAQAQLESNDWRSFCLHVVANKVAVLAKQHTAQRGCTIRSLTHNLALYTPTEINAFWHGPYRPASGELDVFNLLLLPWPTVVVPADFHVSARRTGADDEFPSVGPSRYFDYEPNNSASPSVLARMVERALRLAANHADHVHGIVLPEMALTPEQFLAVENVAIKYKAVLISGLRIKPQRPHDMSINACAIQPLGLTAVQADSASRAGPLRDLMRKVQFKHHRWCLDRGQILQYELGGRLPASRDCWERILIGQRDINFVTLGDWLTMCVLICEDLARQDPVTEVIRAVGPNLVFALLMDGPQLRNRWSSRYASVLAEDPGCSVLSLTSLGMSKRSRPRAESGVVEDKSTVIALWRDAVYGEREIGLDVGHDCCVLSLVCRSSKEYSIDGRDDGEQAHFPVFAGSFSFAVGQEARQRKLTV